MNRTIFYIILFLLYNFNLFADNLTFNNITIEDGLYHSSVREITQDRFGFMWIATSEGLQRFDGRNFIRYGDAHRCNGLITNEIKKLYMDSEDDVLIIGSHNASLSVLNIKTDGFRNYVLDTVFPGKEHMVTTVAKLSDKFYLFCHIFKEFSAWLFTRLVC